MKIILQKQKNNKQIFYYIIVSNVRNKNFGRKLDVIGQYILPINDEPKRLIINKHKLNQWLLKGALPNKKVQKLLFKAGII